MQKVEGKEGNFSLPYDYLILGVGATTNTFGIPGVKENCFFLKEIEHARALRVGIIERFELANLPSTPKAERDRLLHFVVVGGGPTGTYSACCARPDANLRRAASSPHSLGLGPGRR